MSTSSDTADPNPTHPDPDPNEEEDPLLKSGSFIDPDSKTTPSKRQRRTSEEATNTERPDWLPEAWGFIARVRTTGATAGTVDRYYVAPVTGQRLRSKIEVLHYIETGNRPAGGRRKKQPTSPAEDTLDEGRKSSKKRKSGSKKRKGKASVSFDSQHPPEKVSWLLTNACDDEWWPSVRDVKVAESTKQEWAAAFDSMCRG